MIASISRRVVRNARSLRAPRPFWMILSADVFVCRRAIIAAERIAPVCCCQSGRSYVTENWEPESARTQRARSTEQEANGMAWKKSSPEAVRRFDELVAVPGAERGLMFGCPVYRLHGERYATLFEDRVVLRLAPKDAADLLAEGGRMFEPMKGRRSKERVVVPEAIAASARSLRAWVQKAVRYARAE
jgi:hypothetical protein